MIVNIYEAKTQLSKLIHEALAGKEIIIGKAGKPMVKLTPVQTKQSVRKGGQFKGKIWIASDFDTYIPEEFLPYTQP